MEWAKCFDEERKCFTSSFRILVYELLKEHVGSEHVSNVIKSVFKFLNKEADKLPSNTTIRTMNIERLRICQTQIAELADVEDTTLYSDETSKYGEKFMGFHITDAEKRFYVLGVRDLATKSADDTLSTFKEVLQDIDDAKAESQKDVAKKILGHIKNTMSDRAATEVLWHEMLSTYRTEILP